jgi:putative membrane protein
MMDWCHGIFGYGGHWPGGIMMILFWVFLVIAVVLLAKEGFSRNIGAAHAATESPKEILKRRYANGEIDKAEFEQKRKDILGL